MCIIYLFSGLGKLQGESWWNGEAVWISSANLEYQYLIDMTWLANHPCLINFLTHATVFWELTYCALVWPRLTRPWVLLMAVFVHMGIVVAYGMPTFGLVMLIGNLAFVSPETVRRWVDPVANRVGAVLVAGGGRAGQGGPPRPDACVAPRLSATRPHIYTDFTTSNPHCRDPQSYLAALACDAQFVVVANSLLSARRIPSVFESIAIVGATGAVGQLIRTMLEERDFPFEKITFLASKRSAGSTIKFKGKEHTVEGTHARRLRGHRPGDRQHARPRGQGLRPLGRRAPAASSSTRAATGGWTRTCRWSCRK